MTPVVTVPGVQVPGVQVPVVPAVTVMGHLGSRASHGVAAIGRLTG